MRENIYKMSKKLLGNPEFCKKLAEKETFDDTYKFCESIQGGYTKEEFESFLDESVHNMNKAFMEMLSQIPNEKQEKFIKDFAKEFCGMSETDFNILIGKLTPKQMSQVTGGIKGRTYNKMLASSLAALTLVSPMQPAFAAENVTSSKEISGANKNQDKQEDENKQQPGLFKRIWEKTKNFLWNNKGKITVGLGALVVIGVVAAYKLNEPFHKKVDEKVIKPVADFFGKSGNKSEIETWRNIKNKEGGKVDAVYTIRKGDKLYKLKGEFNTQKEALNEINKIKKESDNIEEDILKTNRWNIES